MNHRVNYTVLFVCIIGLLLLLDMAKDEVTELNRNINDQSETIATLLEEFERENCE